MNNLAYYGIRIGLLGVIVILGLVAYAPETLDLSGAWMGAKQKSDYVSETDVDKQSLRNESQLADSEMMLEAIEQGLKSTKYVFSKNKFRTYNQRDWWPAIHAAAIEADDLEVLNYLLSEGYGCDYENIHQGFPAFKAAVASANYIYLETLLAANCGILSAPLRPKLEVLISNSLFPERLKLLEN